MKTNARSYSDRSDLVSSIDLSRWSFRLVGMMIRYFGTVRQSGIVIDTLLQRSGDSSSISPEICLQTSGWEHNDRDFNKKRRRKKMNSNGGTSKITLLLILFTLAGITRIAIYRR